MTTEDKLKKLEEILKGYGHVLIALSGGVDSTFLLAFACRLFASEQQAGGESMWDCIAALTATGPQFPENERQYAESLCDSLGIAHKKIDVSHVIQLIRNNPADRCYHCKKEIFALMKERADMVGSVLCDGTNADDMQDSRPGYRAVMELGVASPLKEAGLSKGEIRQVMRDLGLAADRAGYPAFACLVTRIPYGEAVTEEKLEAACRAEDYLRSMGFSQIRVRCHQVGSKDSGTGSGLLARIELECGEEKLFVGMMQEIDERMRCLGFDFVALDTGGYKKGRMNDVIGKSTV